MTTRNPLATLHPAPVVTRPLTDTPAGTKRRNRGTPPQPVREPRLVPTVGGVAHAPAPVTHTLPVVGGVASASAPAPTPEHTRQRHTNPAPAMPDTTAVRPSTAPAVPATVVAPPAADPTPAAPASADPTPNEAADTPTDPATPDVGRVDTLQLSTRVAQRLLPTAVDATMAINYLAAIMALVPAEFQVRITLSLDTKPSYSVWWHSNLNVRPSHGKALDHFRRACPDLEKFEALVAGPRVINHHPLLQLPDPSTADALTTSANDPREYTPDTAAGYIFAAVTHMEYVLKTKSHTTPRTVDPTHPAMTVFARHVVEPTVRYRADMPDMETTYKRVRSDARLANNLCAELTAALVHDALVAGFPA